MRSIGIEDVVLGFTVLFLFTLAGCAVLSGVVDQASDKAADAVTSYCDNLTVDQRRVFGDQVRAKAAPHSIAVTCN